MRGLLHRLADNRAPASLANRMRRRRFALFEKMAAGFPRPVRVLDVGGTARYWQMMGVTPASGYHVVLLNRTAETVGAAHLEAVAGDARDLSRFGDRAFDIVYSNSVIEHVGDFESRRRMADEVMRVGRAFYVQTPNRLFPIEPHFLMPYFQFWPRGLKVMALRRFKLGWYERTPDPVAAGEAVDSIELIGEDELQRLFPSATIHKERMLGLTKSLIACSAPS